MRRWDRFLVFLFTSKPLLAERLMAEMIRAEVAEHDAQALSAGLTEMSRTVDRLTAERDELEGQLLGLELELHKGEW